MVLLDLTLLVGNQVGTRDNLLLHITDSSYFESESGRFYS